MVRVTYSQQRQYQGDSWRHDSAVIGSGRIWKNSIDDIKRAAENESNTKAYSKTTKIRRCNSSLSGRSREKIMKAHEPTYHDPLFRSVATKMNSNDLDSTIGTQSPLLRLPSPHLPTCNLMRGSHMMQNQYMFKSGPAQHPEYVENSYCLKLFQFANKHQLTTTDFVNFQRFDQNQNKTVYMSLVKIDEWSYSSIPYEHVNLNVVQEYAAQIALTDLTKRFAENDDLASLRTATDERLIVSRIAEMVSDHPNGLKAEFVETKFIELFKEKLPTNWIKIVKSHKLIISVDNLINGFYIYPQTNIDGDILNVSNLPPLILPECNDWNIFLTHCLSSRCVYFRLVGPEYDAKYEVLSERMEINHQAKENDLQPAKTIVEGSYYVACMDNHCYRVKVLSNDPNEKQCRVSLIDVGEEEEVSKECIFPPDKEFTHLPAQALSCSLAGLEEYHENEYITRELKLIAARRKKAFVAKVKSRNPNLVLTLYDTTDREDINTNEKILKKFLDLQKLESSRVTKVINSGSVRNEVDGRTCSSSANRDPSSRIPPFPLPVDGKLRVYISTVLNGGRFIIQPLVYRDELARMTEEMRKYYSVNKPQADVVEIQVGNEFAFENEKKEWRRGLVIDVLKDMGEVSFKCVDYGNVITVDYRMVCSLMPCFRKTPALAMEAQLAGIAPVNSHWSMKDCLHLHDFLVNKPFCAQVVEVVDGVASLVLTYDDVSSGSLIDVGAQFVNEGRAIFTWPEWRR